jgi:kinesin family protein 3/17
MSSSQSEVYETTAKPAVMSILEGYNSTIFAYGQTGTGKTFTMEGFTYNSSDMLRGIIPRSIEEIFNYIELFSSSDTKFMVRASYLQIYNEAISDLLKPEKTSLQVREDKKKGVFVEGLSEWAVRSPADIYTLLQRGASCRATAATKMNDVSSRSHAVFMIVVEQLTIVEGSNKEALTQIKVGKLNLVDLAGSERIRVTGATGKQLEESKKINKSLSALGNVIYALTDSKGRSHIPYRDSKVI